MSRHSYGLQPAPPSNRYPPPMSNQPLPPPPPPPRGGGFGRQLVSMMVWGAGITVAFAGISMLFGPRRTQEVHQLQHQQQQTNATHPKNPALNPAASRPIVNCTVEEEVLRQVERNDTCRQTLMTLPASIHTTQSLTNVCLSLPLSSVPREWWRLLPIQSACRRVSQGADGRKNLRGNRTRTRSRDRINANKADYLATQIQSQYSLYNTTLCHACLDLQHRHKFMCVQSNRGCWSGIE